MLRAALFAVRRKERYRRRLSGEDTARERLPPFSESFRASLKTALNRPALNPAAALSV